MSPSPIMDELHGTIHQSRILIVDDSVINLLFLKNILTRGGFHDIQTAISGEEALDFCDSFKPDMVILDLIMEGMDGFECCRSIRAREVGGDIPILIQTALTDQDEKIRTFKEGATDFITKPIFPDELYARVIVHLEKQFAMKRLQVYKQRVEVELATARDLQSAILPREIEVETVKTLCNLDIASYFKPSSELGGDFWGIKLLSEHEVGFWMVDFSGHGVAAALNVFRLHTCLQEYSPVADAPAKYLAQLNERLLQLLPTGQFATMFYGIIDTNTDTLHYASAGSTNPIILTHDKKTRVLDGSGRPLGISTHTYPTKSAPFAAGDSICFYSDALIETGDASGVFISEETVLSLFEKATGTANQVLDTLLHYYHENTLPRHRRDDLTIGIICRNVKE